MDHIAPAFKKKAFHCPHCNTYALMEWNALCTVSINMMGAQSIINSSLSQAWCPKCKNSSYWTDKDELMIYPITSTLPLPHIDIPDECRSDYEEARAIYSKSPRGAAALLRLSLQKLCKNLGYQGIRINEDIAEMVKNGLPIELQQMMDYVRVTGNNAVHPGELDLEDTPELTLIMFEFFNEIIDAMIDKPKKVKAMYERLPESTRQAIDKRNKKVLEKENTH